VGTPTLNAGEAGGTKAFIMRIDRATRRSVSIVNAGVWSDAIRRLEFSLPPGFVVNDPQYMYTLIAGHEFTLVFDE
jgi:hypothetical protein